MSRDADRLEDLRARELAQTLFDRPLVLEAGAGTGKTTVLVMRVVAWCLGPGWVRAERDLATEGDGAPSSERVATRVLEGVVAITFTEAASAEMEQRIAAAFETLAAGRPLSHVFESALPVPALRRAQARDLLVSLDALEVRTIHGFCRRVLAGHPLEAGLHPRFEVDASGERRADGVRELLAEKLNAAEPDRLAEDLFTLAVRGVDASQIEDVLLHLLEAAVPARAFQDDPLASERIAAVVDRAHGALTALLRAAEAAIEEGPSSRVARRAMEALRELGATLAAPSARDAHGFGELVRRVEDGSVEWKRPLARWAKGDFGTQLAAHLGDRAQVVREAASRLDAVLTHLIELDPELLSRSHRTIAALLGEAEQRMRARGIVSFGALLRKTRELLHGSEAVRVREQRRIQQLLVDEFQDTDGLQCEIVASLALEGPVETRPGLFLVGDPKQSIYGWRNADLEAYERMVERVRASRGERTRLCCNHRSRPEILAEVDRVIEPAMVPIPGLQPGYQRLVPREDAPDLGCPGRASVEHWVAAAWGDGEPGPTPLRSEEATEQEAAALARELVELREAGAIAWSDVGVLLRSMGSLDTVLEALREHGIPFAVDRDRVYGQRREVLDATALVRAVLDPDDRLAQVAMFRSAWVGVPDAAWPALAKAGFFEALRTALTAEAEALSRVEAIACGAAAYLSAATGAVPGLERLDGWEKSLLEAVRRLRELRVAFVNDPPDRFVEKLRTRTLLEATEGARRLGTHRVRNLQRFFRELQSELERHPGDVEWMLRVLRREPRESPEEAGAAQPSGEAVRVMTVHGAKGLHFEHVYVLQLHRGKGKGNRSGGPVLGDVDGRLEYRWFSGDARVTSLGFDRLRARRETLEGAERIRTLYVAMTRAKKRLVLSGGWVPGESRVPGETHLEIVAGARLCAAERALGCLGEGGGGFDAHEDGARWVFLGRVPRVDRKGREPRSGPLSLARVAEEARRLARHRDQAARHEARPFGAAASAEAHEALFISDESAQPASLARAPAAPWARAVGRAVHRFLERIPAEAWDELARVEEAIRETRAALLAALPPDQHAPAWERARSLLDRLRSGRLGARLRAIQPHVLARELPLLATPDDPERGPVGFVAGAIDLLYRDADRDELVVVDFKTDRIPDARVLAERTRAYALQGRTYARAVQGALGTPTTPRVELWFLDADLVEVAS